MPKTVHVHKKYYFFSLLIICLISAWLLTTPRIEPADNSVFVYGTLKYPFIRNVVCLCRSQTSNVILHNYKKDGLNIVPQLNSVVSGKIIYVNDTELSRLDAYENVPTRYRRDTITINNVEHFVYVRNQ